MKRGALYAILLSLVGAGGILTAGAATFNSSNFSINGNLGDSVAGGQNSTNYQLTSAGGESLAGSASSKSYKMGQGYIPTLENSLQVVTQPSNLAAYYPLDDVVGGGPMYDESQNGNNGFYEASSYSLPGKVGNAWSTFNTSQYGTAPDSPTYPAGSVMTVSAWIRAGNYTTQQGIVSKWDYNLSGTNTGEWALQTTASNQIRMFLSSGSGDDGANYVDTTNAGLAANTWAHVTMVYDGSLAAADRIKIYINGVQASTTVNGTIPTSIYAAGTNALYVGDFNGLTRRFSGTIDEVKIYGRALTSNDVRSDYSASDAGVPAGLSIGDVTPGTSQISAFDSIVQTSAGGYTLAINQNNNLTNGGNTIPAVSGTIASPVTWSEGSTKGLGFTLFGTNATVIPGTWGSGAAYAALPGSATSFYTRTNYTGGAKDILNMRLRLDANTSQISGSYTNQMTITGTMIP